MNKKTISVIVGVILIFVAIGLSVILLKNKKAPENDSLKHRTLYVKTSPVEYKKQDIESRYNGKITSYEDISLTPEVSGKILPTQVSLKEGQTFRKGDLLISIYDKDFKANLYSQRSNFLFSLSSILPDLELDFSSEYKKWKDFFDKIDIKKDLPELPKINNDKEQIFLSSKQIISAYYNIKRSEITASKYKIYAPFSGAYKAVYKQVGSVASMGMNIASIIRTDFLEIVVPVTIQVSKHIKVGQKVDVFDEENNVYQGSVLRVANFLNNTTQMVNVYIKYIPTGNKKLIEGEYVEVLFNNQKEIQGMKIPREAIFDNDNVYVLSNNKLQKKQVVIEFMLEDYVIISGVEIGDTIVEESLVDINEQTIVESL